MHQQRIRAYQVGIFIWLSVVIPCAAQTFPGLQLIQPDLDSARPALVATPCGEAESGTQAWVAPLLVYDDSMMSIFVDNSCIIAAVQMGYEQSGGYMVAMYTHYKGSEYPCKYLLGKKGEANAEYQRECKMIGYRVKRVDVDTHARKMIVTSVIFLDIKGFHLLSEKGSKNWTTFTELQKDPLAHPMLRAIEHTTKLVDKELEYWKYRYKQE